MPAAWRATTVRLDSGARLRLGGKRVSEIGADAISGGLNLTMRDRSVKFGPLVPCKEHRYLGASSRNGVIGRRRRFAALRVNRKDRFSLSLSLSLVHGIEQRVSISASS